MPTKAPMRLTNLFGIKAAVAILMAGLLSACGAKSVDRDFTLSPDSETGLIIGSATSSKENSSYDATMYFRYTEAGKEDLIGFGNSGFIQGLTPNNLLGSHPPSDFQDTDGRLFAIALKPGDYSFATWEVDNGSNAFIAPIDRRPMAFTVRKGEATYIGNLHMELKTSKNIFGITIISDAAPQVVDKSERDIPMLLQRYPNLSRENIEIRLIDDRPWGGDGSAAQSQKQ